MRHNKKFNHLGRKTPHRKAMLANMACSLIQHKKINTTIAKAKALRMYVEPLITKSKQDSTHSRRIVFSYLKDKVAVSELFKEVATKIVDRPGGYTRILKTGNRLGDNADMCFIELVDFNETYTTEKKASKTKTRRRGGAKKNTTAKTETPLVEDAVVEEVKTETPKVEAKTPKTEKIEDKAKKADDSKDKDAE